MLLFGKHVDDIKITGELPVIKEFLALLEATFGKLKVSWNEFTNCGIRHIQDTSTFKVTCDQNHYISCLKPINVDGISKLDVDATASAQHKALFISLLGALAYTLLTRIDIAVFIAALQRVAQAPLISHLKRLNVVLRWAQRNPQGLTYAEIAQPVRLLGFSDSAFKREDEDNTGHAMRGCIIVLANAASPDTMCSGKVQVLDYVSRKQKHVCRATFAAELFAAVDTADMLIMLNGALYELQHGVQTTERMRKLREEGGYSLPSWLLIDADSVFSAIAASPIKTPAERSLLIQLQWLKELLDRGIITKIVWCDTRDMVADALTKGSISRDALHKVCAGIVSILHKYKVWPLHTRTSAQ